MATQWTDSPLTSNHPIRHIHLTEIRQAVDCHRGAYGLGSYPWTDNPLTSEIPIRSVHWTELRTAIQDLWDRKSMGPIPNWTAGTAPSSVRPVKVSDTTDLRNWLNQYETNPTGAVYSPLRGLHLRNGDDMRDADVNAAKTFDPRMVVVLSSDVLRPAMLNYLKSLPSSVEIFCRYWPTTYPYGDYTTFEGYNNWQKDAEGNLIYGGGAAIQRNGDVVAQQIVDLYDAFLNNGLQIKRFYPGNEPELEWLSDANVHTYTWKYHTWDDIKFYYRDLYHWVRQKKENRPIELYPPAFAQFSFLGVYEYKADGSVTYQNLDDGSVGADHVRNVIEYYINDTPGVGRVNWHSYFWPGRQGEQSAYNFMPQWLKDHIDLHGYPSRITEFGWIYKCFEPPCNANLDTTTSPCGGVPKVLSSWGDYNDFVRLKAHAGGAAVWLLSSATQTWQKWAGVDAGGSVRPWFRNYICMLTANL